MRCKKMCVYVAIMRKKLCLSSARKKYGMQYHAQEIVSKYRTSKIVCNITQDVVSRYHTQEIVCLSIACVQVSPVTYIFIK